VPARLDLGRLIIPSISRARRRRPPAAVSRAFSFHQIGGLNMKGFKTLLFASAIALAGVAQTFDWATVIPQDKTWSGIAMLGIGAIIAALRFATNTPAGKAVALFAAAALLSLFLHMSPAIAADNLPVKAAVASSVGNGSPCTPTSCTGFYVGGGIGGNGSNLDIIGSGINGSVFAGGVIPDAHVGYIYKQGAWLFGAETGLGYQMNSGVNVNGVGANNNGLFSYQVGRAGGDLSGLFGGQAPISIPPQLANSLISGYGQLGIAEKQMAGFWASGMVSGAGAFIDIGPHAFVNIDYKHVSLNSPANAFVTAKQLDIVTVGFNYKF